MLENMTLVSHINFMNISRMVERCRARANTSFRFEGARITLLQFCAGLQSACTIAENSESMEIDPDCKKQFCASLQSACTLV